MPFLQRKLSLIFPLQEEQEPKEISDGREGFFSWGIAMLPPKILPGSRSVTASFEGGGSRSQDATRSRYMIKLPTRWDRSIKAAMKRHGIPKETVRYDLGLRHLGLTDESNTFWRRESEE